MKRFHTLAVLLVLTGFMGCDFGSPASPTPGLYERMGGQEATIASVETFYGLLQADPMMWRTFSGVFEDKTGQRAERFKTMMRGLMCYMADGGCWYVGLTMHAAHSHMDITEEEYDAMMKHLDKALEMNSVGEKERTEMVELFNGLKSDIVN
jgi:hemoglobin